jgi:hypothetical protein
MRESSAQKSLAQFVEFIDHGRLRQRPGRESFGHELARHATQVGQ